MKKLYAELARIQKELKAPKSQYNSYGKYNYRSCEDILEGLKLVLNGLTVMISDEVVMVGTRIYIQATATLADGENSISNKAYAREPENKKGMDDSQITGTASSYARKYALNGLFLIDDTKDADSMDNSKPQGKHMVQPIDGKALAAKWNECKDQGARNSMWGNLTEEGRTAMNKEMGT